MDQGTGQHDVRFDGFRTLIGDEGFARVRSASVCVVGLGGVGSWVAEALARCGVGTLTLVDLDDVCVTNINRQLQALENTIGMPKASILAERLREINPRLNVKPVKRFFSSQSADDILAAGHDIVVDCIDRVTNKSLLLASCVERKIPVITIGSAGDRLDPMSIRRADLARTIDDPMLAYVRKKLRQEHGFPRGEKRKFGILAIYAPLPPEILMQPSSRQACDTDGISEQRGPARSCNDGLGTAVFVTGAMGFCAASEVIRLLTTEDTSASRARTARQNASE